MTTTPYLTAKELEALTAIDKSEYGEYLTDSVWSFTIVDNSTIAKSSVAGVVSSLNKKGYVINGSSDGERTVEMTKEGAKAYVAYLIANGEKSHKHIDHDAFLADEKAAAAEAVETSTQLQVDTRRVAAKAKKTADEKRLAKNARAKARRAKRNAAKATPTSTSIPISWAEMTGEEFTKN